MQLATQEITITALPQTVVDVIRVVTGGNQELIATAFGAVVDSDESLSVATDLRKTMKERIKFVEVERKKIVDPLNASVKAANAHFKQASQPLEDAEAAMRKKCDTFQIEAEKEKFRIAEDERQRREAELLSAAESNAAVGNDAGAERLLEMAASVKAKPEETGRGGFTGAKASLVTYVEFDLLDIQALAASRPDLVQVNTVAVNSAIRAGGERNIAGLNIREEQRSSLR
jgi:hypothetical protein